MVSLNSMKKLAFIICFFTVGYNVYSQSVYTCDPAKDFFFSMLSLSLLGVSYSVPGSTNSIPDELNRNDINFFDRGLMFPEDETLHNIRDIVRNGIPVLTIITPLTVWGLGGWKFEKKDFDTWLTYGIMYSQAAAFTFGTIEILKKTVTRYRPRSYFDNSAGTLISNDCFPSDTTAFSFLASTLLSVTFSAEFPDSPWKIPVIAGSYALATGIGVIGVISGMHFLTDVLAGAAIGSLYGWLMPFLHRRSDIDNKISFYFDGNWGIVSIKY